MTRAASISSRSTLWADGRGGVYVEFLIAFFPVFLLFLALCQLALLTAARLVVSHAAVAAVRSAIVVLEDPSGDYDGAPFGSLSEGRAAGNGATDLARVLGVSDYIGDVPRSPPGAQKRRKGSQHGARMALIRLATAVPLMTLAPSQSSFGFTKGSVAQALLFGTHDLGHALAYTNAAAAITVHSSASDQALATEPLAPTQTVTVRVAYLYRCAVPLARVLMCRTLTNVLDTKANGNSAPVIARINDSADVEQLKHLVGDHERFTILTGIASLPNQGTLAFREAE